MTQEHLQAISTNGRFPWVPGATFVGVHDTDVKVDENGVHVRLDDKAHDDFWMLMTIPPHLLGLWYHQLEVAKRQWLLAGDVAVEVLADEPTPLIETKG